MPDNKDNSEVTNEVVNPASNVAAGVSFTDPIEQQTRVSLALNEVERVLAKATLWTEDGAKDIVDVLTEARNKLGALIGLEVHENGNLVNPNVAVAPAETVSDNVSDTQTVTEVKAPEAVNGNVVTPVENKEVTPESTSDKEDDSSK